MAQDVSKGRAHSVSFKNPGEYSWGKNETCSILIVFEDKRIIVYSKTTQVFDLINQIALPITPPINATQESKAWLTADQNGIRCHIQIIPQGEGVQLYILYNNLSICYDFTIL